MVRTRVSIHPRFETLLSPESGRNNRLQTLEKPIPAMSILPNTPDGATIWAFNKPGDTFVGRVATSVKEGKSRFGWSYVPDSDLP
jgi:hypothetical protein